MATRATPQALASSSIGSEPELSHPDLDTGGGSLAVAGDPATSRAPLDRALDGAEGDDGGSSLSGLGEEAVEARVPLGWSGCFAAPGLASVSLETVDVDSVALGVPACLDAGDWPFGVAVVPDGLLPMVEGAGCGFGTQSPDACGTFAPAGDLSWVMEDQSTDGDDPSLVEPPECEADWVEVPLPETTPFAAAIERAARHADVNPLLLAAVVEAESGFDPNAVSSAGACGLTQLMPAVASTYRVENVFDPEENLRGGAENLRSDLDRFSSLPMALAAYNAGPSTVANAQGVPPFRETHGFIRRVLTAFCPGDRMVADTPLPGSSLLSPAAESRSASSPDPA